MIDRVTIHVKAGDGGNGSVSFLREKYVSHGGPDGGDGGRGGNIVVRIDEGANTLLMYKNRRKFVAKNGEDGRGKKFHGGNAEDTVLPVPPGTVIRDAESGKVIKDMSNCEPFILCRGGKGGWGNQHFATPTRQIPRFAKSGMKGEEKEVVFELKMLADVGLIGMPNVGKSTILSVISAARPKIADYAFTTLSPNLGVVSVGEGSGFVAADIPGLIAGASQGAGLGHDFLRHIDRCRLLLHVVDVSGTRGNDPIQDIETINRELASYSDSLASRPQIIVGNKCDAWLDESDQADLLRKYAAEHGMELLLVSAATRWNMDLLVQTVAERLKSLPAMTVYEAEMSNDVREVIDRSDHSVAIRRDGDVWVVEAEWLWRLMGSVNFEDRESLRYFQRILTSSGVIQTLEDHGVRDGDTVSIYDFEFDFIK